MEETTQSCLRALLPVRDALALLNRKWTIPVVISLSLGEKRFTQLQNDLGTITPRVLSNELKNLEQNGLITRDQKDPATEIATYALTVYGYSLQILIRDLHAWGAEHRSRIMQ
jgi:DNA-binding HxlR family transcriptional regulator